MSLKKDMYKVQFNVAGSTANDDDLIAAQVKIKVV